MCNRILDLRSILGCNMKLHDGDVIETHDRKDELNHMVIRTNKTDILHSSQNASDFFG